MFCSSCGNELDNQARFCTQCGAATGRSEAIQTSNTPGHQTSQSRGEANRQIRHFRIPEDEYESIASRIKTWLKGEEFEIQNFSAGDNKDVIQVRKKGQWRRYLGMSTALTVQLSYANQMLKVEVGQAHWAGKVATGAASWFVLWPLAVTTAVGVYDQLRTPDKIFRYIDSITGSASHGS